jgi:hypothetical protein
MMTRGEAERLNRVTGAEGKRKFRCVPFEVRVLLEVSSICGNKSS